MLTTEQEFLDAFHDQSEQDFVTHVFSSSDESAVVTHIVDYTILAADRNIDIDASSNTVTITLPASPDTSQKLNISCSDSTFAAEIDLNGNALYTVTENLALYAGQNVTIQWTGSKWIGA